MKSKMARQLVIAFALVILVFIITVGVMFLVIFGQHNTKVHQHKLEDTAVPTAQYLATIIESQMREQSLANIAATLHLVEEIVNGELWLVDRDGSFIVVGLGRTAIDYSDFNTDIIAMIDDIFLGKTVYSKNYSHLLQDSGLTVKLRMRQSVLPVQQML